jgi:hypothetical protein
LKLHRLDPVDLFLLVGLVDLLDQDHLYHLWVLEPLFLLEALLGLVDLLGLDHLYPLNLFLLVDLPDLVGQLDQGLLAALLGQSHL